MTIRLLLSVLIITAFFQKTFSQANAGPDQVICTDQTYLQANDPIPDFGVWSILSGSGTFENASLYNTLVTDIAGGPNEYRWEVSVGVDVFFDDVIIVNNDVTPADAGPDAVICENFHSLAGTPPEPGETGLWTVNAGSGVFVNDNSANTVVNNVGRGLNIYEWTVTNDICSSFDQVSITNLSVDAIINTPDPQEVCADPWPIQANDPTGFNTANPPSVTVGFWTVLSGGSTLDFPNNNNTTVSNLDPGSNTYMWTLDNGTCIDSDTITIINNIPTPADAGPDTIICGSTLPNLYANNNYDPQEEIGFWRVIAGSATITNPTLFNSSVTNLDYNCTPWTSVNAVNVFEWVIRRGSCESTDQVRVLNGLPEAPHAGLDQTVCDNTVDLDALDEASCTQEHWWEQLPDVGDFFDPLTGAFIPDNDLNMPFNTVCQPIQNGMTQFVWHKRNNFLDSGGNPIVCHLTDTVEITSLGLIEDIQAGPDDATCQNWYYLNATRPEDVFGTPPPFYDTSGKWTTIFGSGTFDENTYYQSRVSNMAAQDNVYRWTVTNHTLNCIASDDVYIHNARPSIANAGPDDIICNDFTVISADLPLRYTSAYWTVDVGGAAIINNSCNDFSCEAVAVNISDNLNIFVWHVINEYTGGFGGYTPGNPLVCETTDTTEIIYRGLNAYVGDSITVCGTEAYLNGNEPGAGQTGAWTVLTGTGILINASIFNTQVINLSTGLNSFRWTISNATCTDFADLHITNNLYDAIASVAGLTTICVDSADLIGNIPDSGATGEWSIWAGGGTFTDPFDPTTRVNNLLRGSNIVRWTVTKNGCSNYDDVTITNNMVEAFAGSDIITCGNDAFLVANELYPTETGLWSVLSGSGTILTPSDNETMVTDLAAGVNVFRWFVSGNGCTAQDEVQVSENSFVTAAGFDQTVCDSSVALQAQDPSPGHGIWSTVHSEVTIVNPSSNTTLVTGLQDNTAYTFRWTVYKNGCSAWDEVVITNDLVQAYAGVDQNICESYTFLEADEPVAGSGNWTVLAGAGVIVEPNLYNSEVTNLGLGINIFNWTVTNQTCWTDDIVIITRHEATDATATDQVNCDGISTLDGNVPGSGENGIWEILSGSGILSNPTMYNSMISDVELESESLLSWTVSNENCSNFIEITVTNHGFEINAGPDTTINSEQYQLQGEDPAPGTGLWTVLSGSGIFTNLTLYNTFVSGYSEGENIFSWTVFRNGCTDDDEVVITYDPVNINTISNLKINIFPNPTEGKVKLRSSIELYDAVVELTSSSGRQVYYKLIQKDSKTIELDLSHLAKGIYFVKIKLSDQIKLLKLVKK